MLFENPERQALAVARLENIVYRKEVRARIDVLVQAVAHRRPEARRLEERQAQARARSGLISFVERGKNRDRGEGAAAHVSDGEARARGRLEPLARKGERARRGDVVHVVPRALAPGARLPVAGDRAMDDLRVVLLQRI